MASLLHPLELKRRVDKIPQYQKEQSILEGEVWLDIKGCEGLYQVSNKGRIRTTKRRGSRGGLMKPVLWGAGYFAVRIGNKRNLHVRNVHRIVAEAFLPNPNNLPCVNHIDEDKTNNCVENLEWCTYQHNRNHGSLKHNLVNHPSSSKCVSQYSKDGTLIAEYPSIGEAHRITGISYAVISNMVRGLCSTGGGYIWRYNQ